MKLHVSIVIIQFICFMITGSPRVMAEEVQLVKEGGVYHLPVKINEAIELNFVIDTGAAEVQIPADVALTLIRTGTISRSDFRGKAFYQMADGSIKENEKFNLRSLMIGNQVIHNVEASVGSVNGSLLLGQNALERLEPWRMETRQGLFICCEEIGDKKGKNITKNIDSNNKSKPEQVAPIITCNEYQESEACVNSKFIAIVNSPDDGFLALRSTPSTKNGKLIIKIPHSTHLVIRECVVIMQNKKWCKTTYDNKNGWVSAHYLEKIMGNVKPTNENSGNPEQDTSILSLNNINESNDLETRQYLNNKFALFIASRETTSEAIDLLAQTSFKIYEASFDERPEIFVTENGRYTIGIIMEEKSDCLRTKDMMLNRKLIPGDSYCATTRRLVKRLSTEEIQVNPW